MAGGMCGRGCVWQTGTCMAGGHVWQGVCLCVAGETATAADGTHPTRMHSCCALFLLFMYIIENNHICIIKFIKFSHCSWN